MTKGDGDVATKEELVAAVAEYCRAETAADKDAWVGLFAEGATHEDPVGNPVNVGLEAISSFWDSFQQMDIELWTTDDPIVCGNEVIVFMRVRVGLPEGTHEVGPIVDHIVFNDEGKIVSVRAFYTF